jgi:malonyl-CoA O-methyltransferase
VTSLPTYINHSNISHSNALKGEDASLLIAKSFSKAATNYNKHAVVQQPIAESAIETLNQIRRKEDQSVLDLGCGTALKLEQIKGDTPNYIGVDLAAGMLALANEHALSQKIPSTKFINANAKALPLKDESIELLYSSMALQWCDSQFDVMAEARRVLSKGGRGVIAVLVDGSFCELEQAWAAANMPSRVNQFASTQDWVAAAKLNQLGCNVEEKLFYQGFPNSFDMLKSLKAIGADTHLSKDSKQTSRAISKAELRALDQIMLRQQSGTENLIRLPATARNAQVDNQGFNQTLKLTYKVAILQISK